MWYDNTFDFAPSPVKQVLYGAGRHTEARSVMESLGGNRAFIVTSPSTKASGIVDSLMDTLGETLVGVFDETAPHSPIPVVQSALARFIEAGADTVISIGGGSCVDTAKGVGHFHIEQSPGSVARHIAIPTTLSGAEFTAGAGLTRDGRKHVIRGPHMVASAVILDPIAVATVPLTLTLPSGLNALAHCIEGVCSPKSSAMSDATFLHAIRLLVTALPRLVDEPGNLVACGQAVAGASLASIGIWGVPMGLEHALAHAVGGGLRTPHAKTHAILIAPVMDFNVDHATEAQALIAGALGIEGVKDMREKALLASNRIRTLLLELGLPSGLSDLGVSDDDLPPLVPATMADHNFPSNPRPASADDVLSVLRSAL